MDFIFMLTRQDRTIEDCIEVLKTTSSLELSHIGFKDVGVEKDTLRELVSRIRERGATSYLELVSTSSDSCLRSAEIGVQIGVDRMMGGTNPKSILKTIEGSETKYYPFPGNPTGHPTVLAGSPEQIASDCRHFEQMGCAGVDLLAYRACEAEPIDLVRAARKSIRGTLICAGSIDSIEKLNALREAGCDAFTVGSAVFSGTFSPTKGGTIAQLRDILAAARGKRAGGNDGMKENA